MTANDQPTWRLPTADEKEMMASEEKPIGIMAERDRCGGRVVVIFTVETVEQLRAANMESEDFINEAVSRGFIDDIPFTQ